MDPITDAAGFDWSVFLKLLEYGFQGLSVIMVLLSFFLFRTVVTQEDVNQEKFKAARFYMIGAVTFMIVAGGFELYQTRRDVNILVNVIPWTKQYETQYGRIALRQQQQRLPVSDTGVPLTVSSDSQINVEIYDLISQFNKSEDEIERLQAALKDAVLASRGTDSALIEPSLEPQ